MSRDEDIPGSGPGGTKKLSWWEASKSNAWTDLSLTLPIFLIYHLGVVLLQVRNAADPLTAELVALSEKSLPIYWGLTLTIGVAMVLILLVLGRGTTFDKKRFMWVALEAACYALLMRVAAGVAVGSLPLAAAAAAPATDTMLSQGGAVLSQGGAVLSQGGVVLARGADSGLGVAEGVIMSCGAGFYEEVVFRVGLFGLGVLAIKAFFGALPRMVLIPAWALIGALVFSGWHYVGALGDDFSLASFVFRAACGLVLTGVYTFRGFAPAVWTHTLYDIWAFTVQ